LIGQVIERSGVVCSGTTLASLLDIEY
jgi:hypothetical protein